MYHLDFILCDPHTREPLLVIELDDGSHGHKERKWADRFKDEVLKAAGLPLLRVPCQPAYDPVEIREQIAKRVLKAGQ